MDAAIAYEEQIVNTVRRLPFHKRLEVLRIVQRMAREVVEEESRLRLPQFMQNMIAAGTLELSGLASYVKADSARPRVSLEEFRHRLREKGVSVPIEEYISIPIKAQDNTCPACGKLCQPCKFENCDSTLEVKSVL